MPLTLKICPQTNTFDRYADAVEDWLCFDEVVVPIRKTICVRRRDGFILETAVYVLSTWTRSLARRPPFAGA